MQSDKSGQVKAYQGEIEQLRKKELLFKSFKDEMRSNQWNCEREVRKHIQRANRDMLKAKQMEVTQKLLEAAQSGNMTEQAQLQVQMQQILKLIQKVH
jgi:hypothetical protein